MDSDDEIEGFQAWKGVPGTIILINAFNPSNKDSTTISHAATCRMMRQYLRQSSTHYLAVCLYGTDEIETASFGTLNIIEICPLNLPNLEDFMKLKKTNISSYGQAKEFKLSDALWHCSKMFSNCKKQLLSRTILMLTRLDVPPVESDHKPSYERVVDMVTSNIDIKILNIAQEEYAIHTFYKNLLIDCNNTIPKPVWDLKELESSMYQQSHRHLAIAQLSFEIGHGLDIGVGLFSLLKSRYQQKKVNLDRDTNAIVTSVNKTLKVSTEPTDANHTDGMAMDVDECDNEQRLLPLLKSELLHYQEYGGERIEFTDKEKKMISNPFGPPMLKLLGFKPASSMCKEKCFLKHSYFLYPNENIIEGSTTAFRALHQACMETSVVAICVLCTRVNSKPHIVALSPCKHPLGLNAEIGFDVIIIPFLESVRQIPLDDDEYTDTSQAHKSAMKDILNKLQFDYKPDMFENPKLQSQFRAIETIALLDDQEIEPFVDTTKPNPVKFYDIKGEDNFYLFGAVAKRPATTEPGRKRAKIDNEIDEDLLQNKIQNKKVESFTVEQLKQIIKSRNIPNLPALTGMKKKDLVEIVYEKCSS